MVQISANEINEASTKGLRYSCREAAADGTRKEEHGAWNTSPALSGLPAKLYVYLNLVLYRYLYRSIYLSVCRHTALTKSKSRPFSRARARFLLFYLAGER